MNLFGKQSEVFELTLPLQRHASVASGFTEIEYVRVSDLVDWSLEGLVKGWRYRRAFPRTRLWSAARIADKFGG